MSAKESDNSVHAAIQSLVRHLLQQKMKKKRAAAKGGRFTKNDEEIDDKNYVTISPLEITEKQEFTPLIVTKVPEVIIYHVACFNKMRWPNGAIFSSKNTVKFEDLRVHK